MNYFIKNFFIPSSILIILDILYIYFNKKMVFNQIWAVQKKDIQPRIVAVLLCYIIICGGFCHFVIERKESIIDSFLLGVFVYGTYTLTNYVSFVDWKVETTIMDIIWGGVLFSATNYLSRQITG